jgi:hypothetical protein
MDFFDSHFGNVHYYFLLYVGGDRVKYYMGLALRLRFRFRMGHTPSATVSGFSELQTNSFSFESVPL